MRLNIHVNALILAVFLVFSCGFCQAEDTKEIKEPSLLDQASATVQEVMMSALALTGTPYKFGGTSPDTGFDCSGFVRYVFQQAANLTLPHGARALSQIGKVIPVDQLQPGDLVFYNTLKSSFSHVGIYIGDNRFIHAPSAGGGVHIVNMQDEYWVKRFNGARRIDKNSVAVTTVAQPDVQSPPVVSAE
ncbi:MAG TPA: C40 family peptidase [Methylophilaceae bacterium]|jgi:cell wall-associated NlpC family hydrolase